MSWKSDKININTKYKHFGWSESYLFQTFGVPHQNLLTHQFLDQRVGAPVQLGEEAHTETLIKTWMECHNIKKHLKKRKHPTFSSLW